MPALLLDLDGTLVDTLEDIRASVNHVRARFGLPGADRAAVRGMVGDGVDELLRRALAPRPGLEPHRQEILTTYRGHHQHQCTVHVRPYPGVRATLARWSAEGRPIAVVTNKPEAFARRILEHLDLARYLSAVIGGDTCARRKPDPLPLHTALDRLGNPDGRPTVAGDGLQDLRAGRAIGARTIAALYGFRDADVLRAEGPDACWKAFGIEE